MKRHLFLNPFALMLCLRRTAWQVKFSCKHVGKCGNVQFCCHNTTWRLVNVGRWTLEGWRNIYVLRGIIVICNYDYLCLPCEGYNYGVFRLASKRMLLVLLEGRFSIKMLVNYLIRGSFCVIFYWRLLFLTRRIKMRLYFWDCFLLLFVSFD